MKIEIVKEIRFAVVMYGGVSLAIYINGVAQELLRMVRSTAVKDNSTKFRVPDDELSGIEKLYRELSYLIADDDLLNDIELLKSYRNWLKNQRIGENPLEQRLEERQKEGKINKTARFIVDILSGSSAGGINGVYMAKAIVGGQSLDKLENLWIREGDFSKLLSDEHSLVERLADETEIKLGIESSELPPSLLNSRRMYLKLLMAFEEMDETEKLPPNPGDNSFVDEVDLFVTLTDYWGIPVPIRLFDQLIHERRHRQNLHFRFRKDDELNEFGKEMYPFLAFSARCTSSFPLAFDPMQLEKANELIKTVRENNKSGKSDIDLPNSFITKDIWKPFFYPLTVQDGEDNKFEIEWDKRVFVDGGYLDNKPFGYAIEALAQKQSNVLVDRKLVYVEPEPEFDDSHRRITMTDPPSALKNTLAALTEMPRYETIREDLQQILQRNRLIIRVNYLVSNARKDDLNSLELSLGSLKDIIRQTKKVISGLIKKYSPERNSTSVDWESLELGEIARQKGQIAYPYYRLRVAALTDDLSRVVTQRAGYDKDSDYFLAVRDLVHVWRRKIYNRGEENETGISAQQENEIGDGAQKAYAATPMLFLRDYDYNYRLRRICFVLQQADRLLKFDDYLIKELEKHKEVADLIKNHTELKDTFTDENKRFLQTKFPLVETEIYNSESKTPSEIILESPKEKLRQTVRGFKKSVNNILLELRRDLRQVEPNAAVDEENLNKDLIEDLNRRVLKTAEKMTFEDLKYLLGRERNDTQGTHLNYGDDPEIRLERALKLMEEKTGIESDFNNIGKILAKIYNDDKDFSIFSKSRNRIKDLFGADEADSIEQKAVQRRSELSGDDPLYLAVRAYLQHFYDNFDGYDQIVFPITYETPIGEAANIDVARISPLDAVSLVDEKQENRRKVAGGVFFAFGAFFNKKWRKNDIIWGRLDAVERFVSIILNDNLIPETKSRQTDDLRNVLKEIRLALVEELQEEILQTGFEEEDGKSYMQKDYEKYRENKPDDKEFSKLTDYVREKYEIDKKLAEEKVFETTSRATSVLQNVLREDDFGKLAEAKNIALGGIGLTVRTLAGKKDWNKFLKPFLPSTLIIVLVVAVLILPFLLMAAAVVLLAAGQSAFWFLIVGLIFVLGIYAAAAWFAYGSFKKRWRLLKSFLQNLIYSKIAGGEKQ